MRINGSGDGARAETGLMRQPAGVHRRIVDTPDLAFGDAFEFTLDVGEQLGARQLISRVCQRHQCSHFAPGSPDWFPLPTSTMA